MQSVKTTLLQAGLVAAGVSLASAARADVISFNANQTANSSNNGWVSITNTGSIDFSDAIVYGADEGPIAAGASSGSVDASTTTGSFDVTITAEGVTHDFGSYNWDFGNGTGVVGTGSFTLPPPAAAPEPATLTLLASGLIGLAGARGRFRRFFNRAR